MKKSLIAMAVAGAMLAPAADAATTLYGKVRQALSNVEGDALTGSGDSALRIHDASSRLGVKGSEDLGNGLSAIYQYEFGVGLNNSETTVTPATSGAAWTGEALYNRNQFVGLKGGFGTFLVGRHDVPAKIALGKVGYMFGGQHEADDVIGIGFNSSIRANNVLAYISPNLNGFTFALATVAGEAVDSSGAVADGLAEGVSAAFMYSNGPFYAGLGYTSLSKELLGSSTTYDVSAGTVIGITSEGASVYDSTTVTPTTLVATDDTDIIGVALKYSPGPWEVGYMYEKTETAINSVDAEYESHLLVGGYKFGNNKVMLKYGQGENTSGTSPVDTDVWGLWLEHNFSKRTKIYFAHSEKEIDTVEYNDNKITSIGLEHSF